MTAKPTPREPTQEMFDAVRNDKNAGWSQDDFYDHTLRWIWRLMYDAAPAPPAARDPIAEHIAQSPFGDDAPADDMCARLLLCRVPDDDDAATVREAAARIAAHHATVIELATENKTLGEAKCDAEARCRELEAALRELLDAGKIIIEQCGREGESYDAAARRNWLAWEKARSIIAAIDAARKENAGTRPASSDVQGNPTD